MQIARSLLIALASAVAVYAQNGPNYFTNTAFSAKAGEPVTLTWKPTTEGTVSLILRNGASNNLNAGTPIAQNIANSGSYTWTPATDAVRGSDYTIEIVSDSNPSETNYSAYFVLDSDNTVAASTASTVSAAPLPTTLSTAMTSSMSETTTGTASRSTGSSSTRTSSSPSATNSDLQATAASSTSAAAGARATAMFGMLGAVALGALAL